MQMKKITPEEFVALLPEKYTSIRTPPPKGIKPAEIYVHNPLDVHGKPSSFIIMVLYDPNHDQVFSATSKCDRYSDDFSIERGMRVAANRLFREFMGFPPLYGRDHCDREQPKRVLRRIRTMISRWSNPIPISIPPMPTFLKLIRDQRSKMMNRVAGAVDVKKLGKEGKGEAKKT